MRTVWLKSLVIALLVIGEAFSIYAEMAGAKSHTLAAQPAFLVFGKMFLLITLAGGFLIAGYMLGFSVFKNIWVVSVASITAILVVEPALAWFMFQQLPTPGSLLGLVLGAVGLFCSLLF